jgi:cytidine deaminase
MKKINVSSKFIEFESAEQLDKQERELLTKAREARNKAYAPYSGFSVGAAVLLENGSIFTGNNQENAAYPSGMCAERVATWSALSKYPGVKIIRVFIAARSENKEVNRPVSPCGSCRQTLAEYEIKQDQPIKIYFTGDSGVIMKAESVRDLLPFMFDNTLL